jgi:hypothetical protein
MESLLALQDLEYLFIQAVSIKIQMLVLNSRSRVNHRNNTMKKKLLFDLIGSEYTDKFLQEVPNAGG